jgi:transcriptional regulator with XRE-family HTH domain
MTPGDLRAIRHRIGLKEEQLAELLGNGTVSRDITRIESGKNHSVHAGHIAVLQGLEAAFDAAVDDMIESRPPVLVGFPNDAEFAAREPELAARLIYNSVHRMALAVAQADLAADGIHVHIVELVPAVYQAWLDAQGGRDSPGARLTWASARPTAIKLKDGMPSLREPR